MHLAFENAALRQQVAIIRHKRRRPHLSSADRLFWVLLRREWPGWQGALVIVKADTVVRWHRQAFRWFWAWKSRRRRPGRPRIDSEARALIRKMALENGWGAPRSHGELPKLGIDVCERTVSRYMPRRNPKPDEIHRWKAFLRNQREGIAAMDFFTVPTITFRVLYVIFVIEHARRRVLHVNVARHPSSAWVIQQLRDAFPFDEAPRYQQLRDAFPFDEAPRYLIYDNDSKFPKAVDGSVEPGRESRPG